MTTAEIQRLLRTLHRESLESGRTLREMREQESQSDSDWPAIIAAMETRGAKRFLPDPGCAALRLASFSLEEQGIRRK